MIEKRQIDRDFCEYFSAFLSHNSTNNIQSLIRTVVMFKATLPRTQYHPTLMILSASIGNNVSVSAVVIQETLHKDL
jgi:hypothetical protein